jgi:hypothetical protein
MPDAEGRECFGKSIRGKSEVALLGTYEVYSRQGFLVNQN